jgi:hypothetical protein
MRFLPQFLTRWLEKPGSENNTWSRETPWRQGSVIPAAQAISLRLVDKKQSSKIAIVISHDCDLANDIEDEPDVEVIVGTLIESCLPDKTHAKNVRVLHISIDGPGGRKPVELIAKNRFAVSKGKMSHFGPGESYSIGKIELETLRSWLAARYRRATIPDGLQTLVKDAFEDVAKKKDRPSALRGIWIDFEPELDRLEDGEKYELWVVVVYSTSEDGAKGIALETAKQIGEKLKRKYFKDGVWTKLDLRECVARSDTEFTYYDTHRYRLFRLEYLSLRAEAGSETGNE